MAGRGATGIRRLRPRTRRAWAAVILVVLTFFFLNLLVLRGSDPALELLVFLSGAFLGVATARLGTHLFGSVFGGSGVRKALGAFAGLASMFGIVFAGSALAGIPAFPTAEGGRVGDLIYGFALGFGVSSLGGLGGRATEAAWERQKPARHDLRVVAVILGTVVAFFATLFALFLLLEYAVVPLVRALAA